MALYFSSKYKQIIKRRYESKAAFNNWLFGSGLWFQFENCSFLFRFFPKHEYTNLESPLKRLSDLFVDDKSAGESQFTKSWRSRKCLGLMGHSKENVFLQALISLSMPKPILILFLLFMIFWKKRFQDELSCNLIASIR